MLHKFFGLSAACLAVCAAAAQAQPSQASPAPVARAEVPVTSRAAMHVHGRALSELQGAITDKAVLQPLFLRMALLAKQEATAYSCEGFEVDPKRMVPVMFRTLAPVIDAANPDKDNPKADAALRAYHMMMGGEMAVFGFDPDAYCAYGQEIVKDLSEDKPDESMLVITYAPK